MSATRVKKWRPRWDDLDDSGFESFVIQGVRHSVRTGTGDKYMAAVGRFITFIDTRGLPYDLPSFLRFLHACRKQGASGSTLSGYRAAMLWHQRQFGATLWAMDQGLGVAIKGYKYLDKQTRPPRGAILTPMLRQLEHRYPLLAAVADTTFYCVLRRRQVERMLAGDIQEGSEGRLVLTVRAEKRANARNGVQMVTRKEIVLPEAKLLLRRLAQGMKPRQRLFPNFNAAALDHAISECATHFGWPTDLVYDGMHCLRHGGATVVREYFSRLLAAMGNPAAMAPATALWYSRLNELRALAVSEEEEAQAESSDEGEAEGGEEEQEHC